MSSLFHESLATSERVIYTPSVFARENLLYLQEAGSLKATRPHTSSRQGLSSFLFFIVVSGSGTLRSGGRTWELHPEDCVFLNCSDPYSHTTSRDLWELKWVHFYSSSMPGIYSKYVERGGETVFWPKDLQAFSECLDRIYELASSDDHIRDMRINEMLARLLMLLMEESWHPEKAPSSGAAALKRQSIGEIRSYLDAHFADKVSLDDLAERFFINKYYLARLFREQYGTSIGSYITGLRISRAKELLRFTDMTVEAVGAAVGMQDANYFSRAFRRVEGMTPGEYRRSW